MGAIGWAVLIIFCSIGISLAIKSKRDASKVRLEKIVEEILKEENTEPHEKVLTALDSIPSELSMEESNIVFPFLLKLKAFCKSRALEHSGSFGGCCDSCSTEISRDSFYFLGGWARCENCMDNALYKNTEWYFYLVNLKSWEPMISHDLILEGANIRDAVDKLRRDALGETSLALIDSVWYFRDSNGEKGFFRFNVNGSLRYKKDTDIERSGTWRQDNNVIYMEMNNRFAEYNGITTGTQIEGTAHNKNGKKWTWNAYRNWPNLHLAAVTEQITARNHRENIFEKHLKKVANDIE